MFLFLSKVFAFVVQPIGIIILALLTVLKVRSPRVKNGFTIGTLIFLYLCSNDFIINEVHLAYETRPLKRSTMKPYDVGIVLTGGLMNEEKEPVDNLFVGNHADRFAQALLLYNEGKIKKIVISGGSVPIIGNSIIQEGKLTARFLTQCGVRKTDIILENKSVNTYENALFTGNLLRKYFRGKKFLLISSASHLPRALACFEKQGVAVTPYGTDYVAHERKFLLINLLPSRYAFYDAGSLFHEWSGYVIYKMMGYL